MDNGGPATPLLVGLCSSKHHCLPAWCLASCGVDQQLVWAAHRKPLVQDTVNFPVHLKNFNLSQLRQLCKELRSDIVHTVSKTGGACATDQSFLA